MRILTDGGKFRGVPGNVKNPNIICGINFTRSRYPRDCVANDCSILQLNAQSLDRLISFLTESNSKDITIGTTIYVYDLEQFCCLLFPNNEYFTTSNNDHPVVAKFPATVIHRSMTHSPLAKIFTH